MDARKSTGKEGEKCLVAEITVHSQQSSHTKNLEFCRANVFRRKRDHLLKPKYSPISDNINARVNWIKCCISSVKFSVLINGSPEGFFQSSRGLRQGDPLSSFLFLLAMEGVNYMIRKAKTNGRIKGIGTQTNRGEDMEITHLLYADHSLVFCEAKVEQIRHLKAILTIFEAISGLHVNWNKSFLYPVNQVTDLQFLASNLGCQTESLPTKYLGMPLGANHKAQEIWNDVL
ncbi:uncharacterized protein LOC132062161 [Lycium ferocissimum]|uniref:uncharacterized protein LOC132062161 n=1 Tax=Lycium ferocissimum TaxID=112874 RepID=UPI002814FFCC|nr:uncharacterized protein LOC132062161 [Lycium ferocissimum]